MYRLNVTIIFISILTQHFLFPIEICKHSLRVARAIHIDLISAWSICNQRLSVDLSNHFPWVIDRLGLVCRHLIYSC